jgi:hypothetical protein
MSILYITYDGVLEPLGQSQVLAYQEQLAKDFDIILMSFEKSADLNNHQLLDSMQDRISKTSIKWIIRRYHMIYWLESFIVLTWFGIIK